MCIYICMCILVCLQMYHLFFRSLYHHGIISKTFSFFCFICSQSFLPTTFILHIIYKINKLLKTNTFYKKKHCCNNNIYHYFTFRINKYYYFCHAIYYNVYQFSCYIHRWSRVNLSIWVKIKLCDNVIK